VGTLVAGTLVGFGAAAGALVGFDAAVGALVGGATGTAVGAGAGGALHATNNTSSTANRFTVSPS
jgi:hypothetical protein